MAKKKTTKKANGAKVFLDFLTMVLGGLVLGFIALPHAKYQTSSILGGGKKNISGFSLINFEEGSDKGLAAVLLILTICAGLLILFALLKLLADAKVVKSEGFGKLVGFSTVLFALATLALEITLCIMLPVKLSDSSISIGSIISTGVYTVWATIIVNAVLALGAFVTSLFSIRK